MNTPDRIILPKKFQPIIAVYEQAHVEIIHLSAKVRRLTKTVDDARASILEGMKDFYLAKCAPYIIVRTTGRIIQPSVTLANTRVVTLNDIETITLKDGAKFSGDQILKLYSGRIEGDKIAVTK